MGRLSIRLGTHRRRHARNARLREDPCQGWRVFTEPCPTPSASGWARGRSGNASPYYSHRRVGLRCTKTPCQRQVSRTGPLSVIDLTSQITGKNRKVAGARPREHRVTGRPRRGRRVAMISFSGHEGRMGPYRTRFQRRKARTVDPQHGERPLRRRITELMKINGGDISMIRIEPTWQARESSGPTRYARSFRAAAGYSLIQPRGRFSRTASSSAEMALTPGFGTTFTRCAADIWIEKAPHSAQGVGDGSIQEHWRVQVEESAIIKIPIKRSGWQACGLPWTRPRT